jgi:holliday junction resolvase Hjr
MSKKKGSRTERELLHLFWKHKWFCIRMAGSGSMPFPCPDLLSGKKGKSLAIECKSSKGKQRRYITKEQIDELIKFSKGFGAEAWVAVRFNAMAWSFLKPYQLGKSNGSGNYYFDKKLVEAKGISFKKLIGK